MERTSHPLYGDDLPAWFDEVKAPPCERPCGCFDPFHCWDRETCRFGGQVFIGYGHVECDDAWWELREPWWDDELSDALGFRQMCEESFPDRPWPWE